MISGSAHGLGPDEGPGGRAAWLRGATARIRAALRESGAGLTVVQLQVPAVPIDRALAALSTVGAEDGAALLWDPPEGAAFAGCGRAAALAVDGGGVAGLRERAESLWAGVRTIELDHGGPSTRLFGGLAFAPGAGAAAPWTAFGEGGFELPRLRYSVAGGQAFLAVAATAPSGTELAEGALAALLGAGDSGDTAQAAAAASTAAAPPGHRIEQLSAERFAAIVDDILAGIAAGRLAKVVAARRAEVVGDRPFEPLAVLGRLRAAAEGCVRFALSRGGSTLCGVTPERLIDRHGGALRTEALAGTVARGDGDSEGRGPGSARLAGSAKDREEHALVVREIVRRLAPLCQRLDVAATPRTRALRHVLHLLTPIEGQLRTPLPHVLDLVAALHPTPAVGGLPSAEAVEFIVDREPAARGWYAGPVGWFDGRGDGSLMVALRCAVLEGARAWLWTGAGIVAGSRADEEYAETAVKQRAILVGLVGPGLDDGQR